MVTDIVTGEELAVKLENRDAKMPMLFLEYRFYRVRKLLKNIIIFFIIFILILKANLNHSGKFSFFFISDNWKKYDWVS